MALETENLTYQRELPNILQHEGKFVVISGNELGGIWGTYEDALKAAYEKFKLKPFLVKKIEAVEQIQFFTRDIEPCLS